MKRSRDFVKNIRDFGALTLKLKRLLSDKYLFPGSTQYWESAYRRGETSGEGSYGRLAAFKAEIINSFVQEKRIQSVIELGCGDGNQLSLARYPSYLGLDVSNQAIALCKKRFVGDPTKRFMVLAPEIFKLGETGPKGEFALSLDVIYHLVEDSLFEDHMLQLFDAAQKYVCIYSTNLDKLGRGLGRHMRHRRFTDWIEKFAPDWRLIQHITSRYPDGCDGGPTSNAEFFFYEKF